MAEERVQRRLAAILAADVAGYSRLMQDDEAGTLASLKTRRSEVLRPALDRHRGRVFKFMGDGVLVEFASAVDAVECAVQLQQGMESANADLPADRRIRLRIGINLGDVMVEGSDLYGDGVNIAARLEALADPGSVIVSRTVFNHVRGKVKLGFDDLGEQQLKNIAEPVRIYRLQPHGEAAVTRPTLALPDKPSIAVLPFENMSGDPEQEYFADGISEDIITALSKWRWLFIIARNTSFTYKRRAVDIKQIGRELGVRYVLEGSVRKAGNRVRITAQLIEAATGAHLWAERYDQDLADAFAVQDEIMGSVVGAIEPELRRVEQQRAARKSPEAMDAWDHHMRGLWRFHQFSPEDNADAARLLRRAIELDPGFAPAFAALSRVFTQRIVFEWSEDLDGDRQAAFAAARRAVELDEKDPYAHYALAWTSLLLREHVDAVAEAQKSIDLTPNFALGYYVLGAARALYGRFEQAIDPFQRAMRLSPHDQMSFFFCYYFALAHYHQENYEEAAKVARMGISIRPTHMLYRALAASYGQLGRADEAGQALAEMRRLMPKGAERLWEVMNPYFDPAHRQHFIEGLRKAGWVD
jgi:adenylate cyclase